MALDAILAHKRGEVAARKAAASFEGLLAQCVPSRLGLAEALRNGRPGFLLEVKFASPSQGTIRTGTDLDPVLAAYGPHADAVSVLTDQRFFGGSLARLAEVRARLTQPLLCKDFILEPYQVAEARVHGADAVLLILAAVDDATWRECAALAARLGMDVLTEVHDETEASRAIALGAAIVGVNNRNLRTLAVDRATTRRLAPLIPPDRLVIAESGFESREDVAAESHRADAFLIGSALMRDPDLDRAVRGLVYGRTKVCGLTRPDDAASALQEGATHGGLVFAAESPRRLSLAQALTVRRGSPLEWVGVFADQPAEDIVRAAATLELSAVQLHGHEPPAEVARVRAALPPSCEVWKAERVGTVLPHRAETGADRLLLDGWTPGRLGGAGAVFEWSLLEDYPERAQLVVAGGLRADNVARAARLAPWALDLSSGVESAPGRKDPVRLREFFHERRRMPVRGDPVA